MEFVDGKPLWRGWFDDDLTPDMLNLFRINALESLADAMVQLNVFSFDRGGSLIFDDKGEVGGIAPLRTVDFNTQFKKWVH